MYEALNVVENAESQAKIIIQKDRIRYEKFIEAGEQFAAKHGLIIGEVNIGDNFKYEFFSDRAATHARALGEILYLLDPDGLGHYATVMTKVANHILNVSVDSRELFTISSLPVCRGVRFFNTIIPDKYPAHFAKQSDGSPVQLNCVGPEIRLMNVYASICNPANAKNWGKLLLTETELRKIFLKSYALKIEKIVKHGGKSFSSTFYKLYEKILELYVPGPGRVLIGENAIDLFRNQQINSDRIQVITTSALDNEAQEITIIAKKIGAEITWRIDEPNIPTEHRLRRLTVHCVTKGRRDIIIDVYNSASFELIPFIIHSLVIPSIRTVTIKIGTPFVIMRYRLIDIWSIQILVQLGAIDLRSAKSILNSIIYDYELISYYYETCLANPLLFESHLLPIKSYIGRLEDSELALKRSAQAAAIQTTQFYPPYLPASQYVTYKPKVDL